MDLWVRNTATESAGATRLPIQNSHFRIVSQILLQTSADSCAQAALQQMTSLADHDNLGLDAAFHRLATPQQEKILQTLGEKSLQQWNSLSLESDPQLFGEGLLNLGKRLETKDQLQQAATVYQAIIAQPWENTPNTSNSPTLAQRAKERLDTINGAGSKGAQIDFLSRRLARQVSDPAMLGGMSVAGGVFQTLRLATLSRLLASPSIRALTGVFGAETLAWGTAFSGEAAAFTASIRGINEALGHSQDWSKEALKRDLLLNSLGLFSLKATGALGGKAMGRIQVAQPNPNFFVRLSERAIPQVSMLTGLLGIHAAEVALGLRPSTPADSTLINSLAMLIQFNVGGQLLHGVTGETYQRWQQSLDLQSKALLEQVPSRFTVPYSTMATAEGLASSDLIVKMSAANAPSTIPPPPREPVEVRIPMKSGVQQILLNPNPENLSHLGGEIYKLYGTKDPKAPWLESIQDICRGLSRETDLIERDFRGQHTGSPGIETFKKITRELRQIRELLDFLDVKKLTSRSENLAVTDPRVSKFLQHFYSFPNQMRNFLKGYDALDNPLLALVRTKRALEVVAGQIHEPTAPVFEAASIDSLKSDNQQISAELFKLYSGRLLGKNPDMEIRRLIQDFIKLYDCALGAIKKEPLHKPMIEDIMATSTDLTKILRTLEARPSFSLESSQHFEKFIENFYQAPLMFQEFLHEGGPQNLFEARIFITQAMLHLPDLSPKLRIVHAQD